MRKRAPSERKFSERATDVRRTFTGRSPDFQRDMLHYLTTVVCSENRPKAGIMSEAAKAQCRVCWVLGGGCAFEL